MLPRTDDSCPAGFSKSAGERNANRGRGHRLLQTTFNYAELLQTALNYFELLRTTLNYFELLQTTSNYFGGRKVEREGANKGEGGIFNDMGC